METDGPQNHSEAHPGQSEAYGDVKEMEDVLAGEGEEDGRWRREIPSTALSPTGSPLTLNSCSSHKDLELHQGLGLSVLCSTVQSDRALFQTPFLTAQTSKDLT